MMCDFGDPEWEHPAPARPPHRLHGHLRFMDPREVTESRVRGLLRPSFALSYPVASEEPCVVSCVVILCACPERYRGTPFVGSHGWRDEGSASVDPKRKQQNHSSPPPGPCINKLPINRTRGHYVRVSSSIRVATDIGGSRHIRISPKASLKSAPIMLKSRRASLKPPKKKLFEAPQSLFEAC